MKSLKICTGAVLICLSLAACAAEPPAFVEPQTDTEAIQYWLDAALAEGASDHQVAVLERALTRGTVLREDVNETLPDFYDCLDAAGLQYYVNEQEAVPGSGISIPGVSVVVPSDGDPEDKVATQTNACTAQHQGFIAAAYANQPTSRDVEAKVWTGAAMRDCLTEHGFTIDEDATAAEIKEMWDADITNNIDDTDFFVC